MTTGSRYAALDLSRLLMLGCLCWVGLVQPARAFEIDRVDAHWENNVLLIDAKVDFALSDEARNALESGVPLVLMVQIQVMEPREYLWDRAVATLQQRYRLTYHALSERYIVDYLNTGVRKSFSSLHAALYSLGRIDELPLLDRGLLNQRQVYYGQLRVALDVEALPTPMRVWAYVSSDWRLTSDWYRWPILP